MRLKNYLIEQDKITQQDIDNLERYADMLFKSLNIDVEFTKHFIERVNHERNKKQITFSELVQLFRKARKKHGSKIADLPDGAEAILKDMATDINIPFVLDYDRANQEIDLVAKTVMRKKNFRSRKQKLRVG